MKEEERDLLHELLGQQRILSLSVLIDEKPYVGMLPFAMRADFSGALIHASAMARHTAGLLPDAPFAALVHEPDHWRADPQQLARVSLEGVVHPLERDTADYEASRDLYLGKFPRSQITFQLADFRIYQLAIERARFVAGFGRTYDVDPATLAEVAAIG